MGRLRVPYQPDPPARAGPDDHWTLLAQDLRRLLYREFIQAFCHLTVRSCLNVLKIVVLLIIGVHGKITLLGD